MCKSLRDPLVLSTTINIREASVCLSLTNTFLLARGFFPKLGFLQIFFTQYTISLMRSNCKESEIVTWDEERSGEAVMGGVGGGGAQRPVLRVNEPKRRVRGARPTKRKALRIVCILL
jgi:hypothetical protein